LGISGAVLHFTSAWYYVYPMAWQSSNTTLWVLSSLECIVIAWSLIWLAWRIWNTQPQRNVLKSSLLIRSSDTLNKRAEFRIGRRVDSGAPVYLPAHMLYYNV